MNNEIYKNVEYLFNIFNKQLTNDNKLLVLYWQKFDGVEINKESISTPDFIKNATSPIDILGAKTMLEIVKQNG